MEQLNYIPISEIGQELKKLSKKNKEEKKISACLFNLIVYSENLHRRNYFNDVVLSIIQKIPCRVILIEVDSNIENKIEASVSSESVGKKDVSIVYDQITIRVSKNYIDRVSYVISPILVTDLPIYLFWGAEPKIDDPIRLQLMQISSRIIFDTENISNMKTFSENMLNILSHSKIDVIDVQWTLNHSWRNVFVQIFENEKRINQLKNAKKIVITANKLSNSSNTSCNIQSFYLQAWLASRMEWNFKTIGKKDERLHFKYESGEGEVDVFIGYVEDNEMQCGTILEVEICGKDGFHVSLKRQKQLKQVIVKITEETSCELPCTVPLLNLKRGFNFIREIFYKKPGNHYLNILKQLVNIDNEKP